MIYTKFLAVTLLFNLDTCIGFFCEICPEHTLCLYPISGPSSNCENYNNTFLLTENDANEILNKINERRNYVALGLSRHLPQAANMRKITWSMDLATFAQRWVDQCIPATRPDLEDSCRDLKGRAVGQNIATVLGAAPGLNVKSFIEIWFMQMKAYSGSVAYFNQSTDNKSNYFTQLIWAEADIVGCGKASFHVNGTIVGRLVCNFATKGNIHGQPVYIIGYPATQCPISMKPDDNFIGLCTSNDKVMSKPIVESEIPVTSAGFPSTSYLRIFFISNNTARKESDSNKSNKAPIINQIKQRRYQKARHVPMFVNNSYDFADRPWRFHGVQDEHQHDKGHSRIHHTHDTEERYGKKFKNNDLNYRRIEPQINKKAPLIGERRHSVENQCTRKDSTQINCCFTNQCTRGQKISNCNRPQTSLNQNDPCSCIGQHTSCPTTSAPCKCHYIDARYRINQCQMCNHQGELNGRRTFPEETDLAVKSGNINGGFQVSPIFSDVNDDILNRQSQMQKKKIDGHPEHFQDYSYDLFDFVKKNKKRDDSLNFKPFWQMEEFDNSKKPELLKSLRYTTLFNQKNRRTRRTTTAKANPSESYSIDVKQTYKPIPYSNNYPVTEKYLSFDELMHIRKFTTPDVDSTISLSEAVRRHGVEFLRDSGNNSSTTAATTTASINTPFIRLKYCTRKLTCTWTMPTGPDGKVTGGGGHGAGSKTPPGYVDGCTRTSTCTRDFLERNKMEIIENLSNHTSDTDEDYCEKKSLNIRRRDSNELQPLLKKPHNKNTTRHIPVTPSYEPTSIQSVENEYVENSNECICESKRKKRENAYKFDNVNTVKSDLSYGDLFYIILQKIRKSRSEQCMCNSCNTIQYCKSSILLSVIILFYY